MSITGVWYHCTFSFIYYKNKRRLESQRSEYDCKPTFIRVLDNFERFVTASSLLTLIFTVNEFITRSLHNKRHRACSSVVHVYQSETQCFAFSMALSHLLKSLWRSAYKMKIQLHWKVKI